jgi:hypothetical protein
MNKKERLGSLAIVGVLAFAGVAAAEATTSRPTRNLACSETDKWEGVKAGERIYLETNGAVAVFDGKIDGVVQNDNDANTSTVSSLKSKDKTNKIWTLDPDYIGSVYILGCGNSYGDEYYDTGRILALVDSRLGLNDAVKRVNFNWLKK